MKQTFHGNLVIAAMISSISLPGVETPGYYVAPVPGFCSWLVLFRHGHTFSHQLSAISHQLSAISHQLSA
ncbi:MAG: hypothetical protein ACOCXS_03920, partial [Bacteroidota bacterium]